MDSQDCPTLVSLDLRASPPCARAAPARSDTAWMVAVLEAPDPAGPELAPPSRAPALASRPITTYSQGTWVEEWQVNHVHRTGNTIHCSYCTRVKRGLPNLSSTKGERE